MGILASSQITITDLTDGEGAITLILSNDPHALPASSTGAVSSYAGSGTELRVYEGTTLLTYKSQLDTLENGSWKLVRATGTNITPGAVSSGAAIGGKVLSAVAGNSSGVAELVDTSTIVYRVQVKNLVGNVTTVTKQQSITKAKAGIPSSYVVINGEQVFKFLAGEIIPTSTSITLSAELFGGLNTYAWEYYSTLGDWEAFSGATSSTFSLTYDNTAWGNRVSLRVRCRSGTAYDETTIVKLYDANDVYTLTYTNQVLAVPVTTGGVEDWTSSGGRLQFFRGITALTLDSNSVSSTAPTDSSRFALNIVKVSGNTLTVPSISGAGTNSTTLGNWGQGADFNLEGPTVYRLSTRVKAPNGTTVLRQIDVTITPAVQGDTGADGNNTAIVSIYKLGTSSSSAPTGDISGSFTYTFSTKALTAVVNSGVFNSWSTTLPTATPGNYIWVKQATAYSNTATDIIESTEFSGAVCLSGTGINGLNSATVYLYRVSTSNSTAPDSFSGSFTYTFSTKALTAVVNSGVFNSWSTTPPGVPQGSFLWVRQATASSNTDTDTISIGEWSGAVVISGSGSNGAPGVGISSVTNYYYKGPNNTGVTVANVVWSTTAPTLDATNKYLWNYEKITYTDSTTTDSTPAVIGTYSIDGKGISSITEYYAVSSSNTTAPSTWFTTTQTTSTTNRYLWNYETINYTTGSPVDTVKRVIGTHGATGVGISSVTNYYYKGPNNTGVTVANVVWSTTAPTLDATNKYLWNYEKITYTDSTTTDSTPAVIGTYSIDGKGISSITEYYAVSSSNTTAPSTWFTTTQTTSTTNRYLWNYETINYTTGSPVDTVKRVIGTHGATGDQGPSVQITTSRPAVFSFTDNVLNSTENGEITFTVTVSGVTGTPTWSFSGFPSGTIPTNSGTTTQKVNSTQFGTSRAALVTCTVGAYSDTVTIERLDKSTAEAGATYGATAAQVTDISTAATTANWSGVVNTGGKPADNADVTKTTLEARVSLTTGGLTFTNAAAYISAGTYDSYAWPSSGSGFYLSSQGLLLGNKTELTGAQWFQAGADGYVDMPGLTISGGNATFSGSLNVKSAASGARVEITNSVIKVFDGVSDTPRVKIGNLSL